MLKNPNPKNVKTDNKGRDTALLYFTFNTKIKPLNLSEWRVIHAFSIQKSSVLFTITYVQKHVISGFTEKT